MPINDYFELRKEIDPEPAKWLTRSRRWLPAVAPANYLYDLIGKIGVKAALLYRKD